MTIRPIHTDWLVHRKLKILGERGERKGQEERVKGKKREIKERRERKTEDEIKGMRDRVKREKGNKKIGKKRNRVIGKQIKINKGERGT